MNKLRSYFELFLLFIIIYILFKYNYILNKSVIDAFNLWLSKIFPTLFIMFILNDIIINMNLLYPLIKLLKNIFNRIFNTDGYAIEAFLLAIISGTPTIAYILKKMININKIDNETANQLIKFTYFSNPLFLYNILSTSFTKYITIKIIIIHYITNIIIGLLYRNANKKNTNYNNKIVKKNMIDILPSSIVNSLNTMLMILGVITFYMIITNILISIFNVNSLITIIIRGLMEITQALNSINIINVQTILKEIIAISIISFGGLSIHTQVYTILRDTNISYKNFLKGRILHTFISAITYMFVSRIIG